MCKSVRGGIILLRILSMELLRDVWYTVYVVENDRIIV